MINLLPLNHCIWRIGLLIHRLKELPTRARVIFYRQLNQKRFLLNVFNWVKYWRMAIRQIRQSIPPPEFWAIRYNTACA